MFIHLRNIFILILSIEIGINLWFDPQISEHCPKNIPGWLIIKFLWLIRPGEASIFNPRDGIVHEWITSVDVINIRICVLNGKINRLSVSSNRNSIFSIVFEGFI